MTLLTQNKKQSENKWFECYKKQDPWNYTWKLILWKYTMHKSLDRIELHKIELYQKMKIHRA